MFSNHLTVPISISFNFLWGALFGFLLWWQFQRRRRACGGVKYYRWVWISYGNCNLFFIASSLFRWFICINSSESCPCSISAWKKIIQANMIVIQYIFSLLCVIVPLMTIYFLMSRPAMQREPVENDERAVLASRTITNGERRWASENISHSIQPSRNSPTEHDERYD